MKIKEIVNIACKVFGLYFLVLAAISAKQIIYYGIGNLFLDQNHQVMWFYLGLNLYEIIFYLLGAWVLVAKSEFVASKIIKVDTRVEIGVTKIDLIEIAVIIICVVFIVDAIPEILNKLTHYIYFSEHGRNERDLFWDDKNRRADIIYSILKFSFGLVVITNARMVAKRLTKIGDKYEQKSDE